MNNPTVELHLCSEVGVSTTSDRLQHRQQTTVDSTDKQVMMLRSSRWLNSHVES